MSGVKATWFVPGTNSQAYAEVKFNWPAGQCDEEAILEALEGAVFRARRLMGERKAREDQATASVGSGEG